MRPLMIRKNRSTSQLWAAVPAMLLIAYGIAYLLSTELHRGSLGGDRLRIRLFHSASHQWLFFPMLRIEQWLWPSSVEFSGQVRSGASLPPPEP